MGTFIAAFVVFLIAIAAMALGVLISNRMLKGSCGGAGSEACGLCSPKQAAACADKHKEALEAAEQDA